MITENCSLLSVKPLKEFNERNWCSIYALRIHDVEIENEERSSQSSESNPFLDTTFFSKSRVLERIAIIVQYQLAYLSTLGGAYHLCNRPKIALEIAKKQEAVGRFLGSTQIIVRALVFQAVNLRILGYPNKSNNIFRQVKGLEVSEEMLSFILACENWVIRNYDYQNNRRQ